MAAIPADIIVALGPVDELVVAEINGIEARLGIADRDGNSTMCEEEKHHAREGSDER